MARQIKGVAVKGVNLGDVKMFPIPVPPMEKQLRFEAAFKQYRQMRAQQHEAIRQADHLFDTLLHRAFRGGL